MNCQHLQITNHGQVLHGTVSYGFVCPWCRLEIVERALAELVACKDLKDRMLGVFTSEISHDDCDAIEAEYRRRQPLAWEAARAAMRGKLT